MNDKAFNAGIVPLSLSKIRNGLLFGLPYPYGLLDAHIR